MDSKRTLLKNADWIITMDKDRRRIRHGDLLMQGERIQAVAQEIPVEEDMQVIDARGKVIIPGMVNTHHHCFQSLVRNIHVANELSLMPWLKVVYTIFQYFNPDMVYYGAQVGLGELLKSGCTTSSDHHYIYPSSSREKLLDVTIKSAREIGMRFTATRGSLSLPSDHIPSSLVESVDEILKDSVRLIQDHHDESRYAMTQIGLAPCWPEFDVPALWDESMKLGREYGVHLHSHLAESKDEVAYCLDKFGCRPTEYVADQGWFGENVWFAHCVHLSDSDIKLFSKSRTGISHCPISNMKLSSGACRVPELLAADVPLSIGVDGAASNNGSNMLTEIRVAYLLHQLNYGSKGPDAETILEMATVGGARVLGRDDIGYLAPDMAADLVLIDWNDFSFAGGTHDPVSAIVTSGDSKMVDTVYVNGECVVEKGSLTLVDEEEIVDRSNRLAKRLLKDASVEVPELSKDIL